MEIIKRKPRASVDESAAVKAAAWAWYQRGSGGADAGNPAREYGATRRRHGATGPSRYKLEAMRLDSHNKAEQEGHSNLPLLDAYEIESISRQLDSLIECSNPDYFRRQKDSVFSDDDSDSVTSFTSASSTNKTNKSVKKMVRGFWLRHAAAVCSARDGVVETAMRQGVRDGRQRAESHGSMLPVVMASTGRPWNGYVRHDPR